MKKLRIPNPSGEISVVSSKSEIHRLLFIAVLCKKEINIKNVYFSDDIKATINVLKACGADITCFKDSVLVRPNDLKLSDELCCNESGTTLRFILPFVMLVGGKTRITGKNKLVERPVDEYFKVFDKSNIKYEYNGRLPITVEGRLKPGPYEISGARSSQFISALLIALSFLDDKSTLIIKDELQSKSYVDLTIKILKKFDINIIEENNKYIINPYKGTSLNICNSNADYSQAAFFLVMNALGAKIKINNLEKTSMQGDFKIIKFLESSGVIFDDDYLVIKNDYKPIDIDLSDNPDLAPVLSLYASKLNGKSYLRGLERLKYKESDRLEAIEEMFKSLGVSYERIDDDTLIIEGNSNFKSCYIDVKNDHRILFTAAVASMFVDVVVKDILPQLKSYPTFFDEYLRLGGIVVDE